MPPSPAALAIDNLLIQMHGTRSVMLHAIRQFDPAVEVDDRLAEQLAVTLAIQTTALGQALRLTPSGVGTNVIRAYREALASSLAVVDRVLTARDRVAREVR